MRIYLRLLVAFLLLSAGNVVYAEAQQEKRVTGTVTSEGEPLPGVSVQVKGASSGTITDIDGNYSIEAPANGTIVFRFVGLRTVEQAVNNRNVINVTMESESKELEEVMVVAYATAKKYSFTVLRRGRFPSFLYRKTGFRNGRSCRHEDPCIK